MTADDSEDPNFFIDKIGADYCIKKPPEYEIINQFLKNLNIITTNNCI